METVKFLLFRENNIEVRKTTPKWSDADKWTADDLRRYAFNRNATFFEEVGRFSTLAEAEDALKEESKTCRVTDNGTIILYDMLLIEEVTVDDDNEFLWGDIIDTYVKGDNKMTIETILEFFEENEDLFIETIEELDSYMGYLGDDRIYDMDDFDELTSHWTHRQLLENLHQFDIDDDYFQFTIYGLDSMNYKDYSDFLDKYFVEELLDYRNNLYLDDEVEKLLKQYEEENTYAEDEEDD